MRSLAEPVVNEGKRKRKQTNEIINGETGDAERAHTHTNAKKNELKQTFFSSFEHHLRQARRQLRT